MITHFNGSQPHTSPGSAVYVDTENLRDTDRAQDIIDRVVTGWPASHPSIGGLSLYVRADKTELWQLWAEATYPALRIRTRGVQHFSNNKAKNSADLAIAADAVADLITGQAAAIAVISNDSDFGALFVKVHELARNAGAETVPFLWITDPDGGGLSPEMERFIPAGFRWNLDNQIPAATTPTVSKPAPLPKPPPAALSAPSPASTPANPDNADIAEELIRQLPIGRFKVADAQRIIQKRWPQLADADDTAKLGTFLLKQIWPLLEKRGVTMPRKNSPRTYEITQSAKDSVAAPPSRQPTIDDPTTTAVPAPAQLVAAVAAGIADDIFSASQAQHAIKVGSPAHPAVAMTPQRFGVWFAEKLWPIMQQHGVIIAKEKPRRYEMTPDARHRIINLA